MEEFLAHTYRISGVVPITANVNAADKPHLEQAMQVGRSLMYLIYQTDGREDNAPMLGSFTSLYVVDKVSAGNNQIYRDFNTLLNTITVVGGNNVSNITDSQMNVFISDISSTQSIMDTQRNGDITFYTNSLSVMRDYQNLLQFTNLGATQNSLISIIGTPKLHSDLGY